jgi:predicted nucleic acid-binding protein
MNLEIVSVTLSHLMEAAVICATHGLLMNDATVVAIMRSEGIHDLATNDDDFDGIPDITVWKPR